mgnify:FL=1|jgi:hypothetical protein
MAAKKKTVETFNPVDQITDYLEAHKKEHLNFDEETNYIISSGSLLLDNEMAGGLRPSIIRASGVSEGGKTSCALAFAKNFQETVENGMVVYFKAEGRLSPEMLERSGLDVNEKKLFIYKCNIFESVLQLIRELILNNPTDCKYFFIIDSMDALIPKVDFEKGYGGKDDAHKVAGGSVLSSTFLKQMALPLSSKGHICFMISQVRSKVSVNKYEKGDPKLTNASGGNALLHYSDWILEFQQRHNADRIPNDTKEKPEGHYCKIVFRKTTNEKTGTTVRYPIKYGRTNGTSIWREQEVAAFMSQWEFIESKGAWITVADPLIEELKKEGLDMQQKHQGADNFAKYLEENSDICDYLFKKFRAALTLDS